jgi:hypothetical protein
MQKEVILFFLSWYITENLIQIQVSKYYLNHRSVDQTLQGYLPSHQYVKSHQEAATIEIGNFVQVLVGD